MDQMRFADSGANGGSGLLDQLDVLIRLYEGAIQFLQEAQQRLQDGREDFSEPLGRARRIIEEFQRTLDVEACVEVTRHLRDLYAFMIESIDKARATVAADPLGPVIHQLGVLLEGWKGAQPLLDR
ncbi:flagellar export chaperone FliS [Magnetofaba australis]|uniref:Putative flagellar protein FliS n=1 Tax=Magnetofaba australis IT-1 TaxID=1434232 RepID=A0A1Y2K7B3_9PROT|nr:flagellar export chaperone FliS [Magnetofaba australis]OSM06108.1 putative flagellar protein FliS [Magnetofaba australis IT-1]